MSRTSERGRRELRVARDHQRARITEAAAVECAQHARPDALRCTDRLVARTADMKRFDKELELLRSVPAADEAAMLAPPRLKKVLSNEGRRLLQSIGEQEVVPAPAAIPEEKKVKKKKKKKQSYQDLMSSFTKPTQTDEEVRQAHQARLASSLGGGQFSKLDKI